MKHEGMSEILFLKHENFHTKTCEFTAPEAHMPRSFNYTRISIQPTDKAVEYPIYS